MAKVWKRDVTMRIKRGERNRKKLSGREFKIIKKNYKARASIPTYCLALMTNVIHIVHSFLFRFKGNGVSRNKI